MNAIPAAVLDTDHDAKIVVEVILYFDPRAANAHSGVYRRVRDKLFSWGWTERRFNLAVRKLRLSDQIVSVKKSKDAQLQAN